MRSSATGSGGVVAGLLSGLVVAIDPGHDGGNASHVDEISRPVNIITKTITCDTTGTEGADGYTESAFNLDVALRLRSILEALGARVVMTRTTDTGWGPCISERAAIGNMAHANAAISIHADGNLSSVARGFTVLEPLRVAGHNDAIVAPSARLARDIRDGFVATGMPISNYSGVDGIVARNDLGGLNLSTVPKVFIECGNMRNPVDLALLEEPHWRQRAAQSIANGLAAFLGR
jgi:N-acetylmuramoyl-L-alanine amidase